MPRYLLGQDSGYPATNFNSWNSGSGSHIDVTTGHASLIRTIGASSTVLLKNKNAALPLKAPKSIAIIGNAAAASSKGPNGLVYIDKRTRPHATDVSTGLQTGAPTTVFLQWDGEAELLNSLTSLPYA
jgi:beta-glucosidase-like glycosyl hydrolase